jgi:hypothetical protein
MNPSNGTVRARFIAPDGSLYPDDLICSGRLTLDLKGQPCPFSQDGRLPDPQPLDPADPTYSSDKGKPGDLCPPCAKQQLAALGHWDWHRGQTYPEELKPLRLFKCSQWLWLVVPGLRHDDPTHIRHEKCGDQKKT